MHHYPFHIKDYHADTAHLSNEEDLCFRRLLDFYYDTEQPIPLETDWVARRLRVGSEVVKTVLSEFFIKGENGWSHARCDDEIRKYHLIAEVARTNGKLGGRPKKTQREPSGNRLATQRQPRQKLTKNQEPRSKPPISPVGFDVFWNAYPKKVGKGAAEKAWSKAHINGELQTVLDAIKAQSSTDQWKKDGGQYIPNPATWINQRRWEDGEVKTQSPFAGGI